MTADVSDRVIARAGAGISAVARHRVVGPAVVVGATTAVCAAVWVADPTTPGGVIPVCPTKALLGIDCPGCGSMRALYSLMHGDVLAALHFNAVGVVALGLLGYAFVAYCVRLWRGTRIRSWQQYRYAPQIILIVFFTWFLIRNIPLEPFRSLRV